MEESSRRASMFAWTLGILWSLAVLQALAFVRDAIAVIFSPSFR